MRLQAESNLHHPPGARPGSVIDGEADIGKTIVTQFGRKYELGAPHPPAPPTQTGRAYASSIARPVSGSKKCSLATSTASSSGRRSRAFVSR